MKKYGAYSMVGDRDRGVGWRIFLGKGGRPASRARIRRRGGIRFFHAKARGRAAGGGFTTGQIAAIGSRSITLQLANGNSQVVFYSSSTPVSEPTIGLAEHAQGGNQRDGRGDVEF